MSANLKFKSTPVRERVSKEEWEMRVDLAACYQLGAIYKWTDLIYTHFSARVPGTEAHRRAGDWIAAEMRKRADSVIEQRWIDPPGASKRPVPQLQPPIGREHRQRFEQAVEGRGAGAQQGVAGGGQRELFGPVLRDQHQPAIGHRLRDDPNMRAV